MLVIHLRNRADLSAGPKRAEPVVEQALDDVRRDAQGREFGGKGPAQVAQLPGRNGALPVEVLLALRPMIGRGAAGLGWLAAEGVSDSPSMIFPMSASRGLSSKHVRCLLSGVRLRTTMSVRVI
jgi:hypothetical protein